MIMIGLSVPFNHLTAFSAASVLPLVSNQTGDSGAKRMPMNVKNGTIVQT